jgi:hypothetical protein
MIYKISITAILFLTTSCLTKSTEKNELNYKENKTSFFDLAHGDWTKNQWIRKPENLKMLHATFKKFGYVDLIPSGLDSSSEFFLRDIYIKRNFYQLFDSLELTYTLDTIEDRYYREFWQRRKMEKNSTIVFEIVRDINNSRHTKLVYRPDLVNDTLFNLLEIQFEKDTLTSGQALINFETLKKYGFHQSAHNLLFERIEYSEIDWNKDSLASTLDTSSVFEEAWFQDNKKVNTPYNNGEHP